MAVAIPMIAMAALAAAGTVVTILGQQKATEAQEGAAKFNAAVASNNALSSRQAAAAEAERIRQRNRRLAGAQRANYAKAGIDISFGTPQDVILDSAVQGEMDAMTTIYQGQTTANNQNARAVLFKMEGEAARASLPWAIAGTALQGAATIASAYGTYKANQPPKGGSGVTID